MEDKIRQTIETYDKYAKIYADHTSDKLLQFPLNKFISLLPKKARILDAGCGCGRDVQYFKDYDLNPIGIDISAGLIDEAKKRFGVEVKQMDIRELKFDSASFDAIWCCASLSHLEKKDLPKVVSGFNNILKKGGILYISVEEGEGEEIVQDKSTGNAPRYFVYYNKIEIEDHLDKAGFEILNSYVEEGTDCNWLNVFCRKK